MKVLIVDDDFHSRTLLADCLALEEIEVILARDGVAALAIARDHADVDRILVDYRMPRMDGLAFIRTIRARRNSAHIPILLMSSEWQVQGDARAMGVEFIPKPLDFAWLLERLRAPASPVHVMNAFLK